MADGNNLLYVGVDVGGTKILAALSTSQGGILGRERKPTPRTGRATATVSVIAQMIGDLLRKNAVLPQSLGGIGLAVPGIVGDGANEVTFAPNLNIAGVNLVAPLKKQFGAAVVLGNDVNVGTLGEKWMGAAREANSAVGIFVGTGIGGGIIHNGRLLTGHNGSAGEIGHMIMQIGGPRCGCGALGCLEALASRTAIERDLRQAMKEGRKTILTETLGSGQAVIKSGMLQDALSKKDTLVTDVMKRASQVLGQACVTIRHLLDPDVIILGGGVVEACGSFILPIVRRIVACDKLLAGVSRGKVVASELGDDAVVLGAVALAQQANGIDPFEPDVSVVDYPRLTRIGPAVAVVGGKTYREDIFIRANGKIKKRRKTLAKVGGKADRISAAELQVVCKGMPGTLIVAEGSGKATHMDTDAETFLSQRNIKAQVLPAAKAPAVYNALKGRKAALIRVGH